MLLIGALGSGLWEVAVKDLLYWLGSIFVRLATSIHSGYIDRLYEQVGSGADSLYFVPSLFILLFIIASPFIVFYILRNNWRKLELAERKLTKLSTASTDTIKEKEPLTTVNSNVSSINENINSFIQSATLKKRRYGQFIVIMMVVYFFISVVYTDLLIASLVNLKAVKGIERRLEIIRPYTSDRDYMLLVSEFRQIDDREKTQVLISKINSVATESHVILPKLDLYGIN